MNHQVVLLIPCYRASKILPDLVSNFESAGFSKIVVVRDGDNESYNGIYSELASISECHVLTHQNNQGKGAALKTGFKYICRTFPDTHGVVTVDADGQHCLEDVKKVVAFFGSKRDHVIIGSRSFDSNVPIRSKFGNKLTKILFLVLVGLRISDTQSGLRVIPQRRLPEVIMIPGDRYEFELNMLLEVRKNSWPIAEFPITTIYLDDNKGSSFNPLLDSFRIYRALFLYAISAVLSFVLDISLFAAIYYIFDSLLAASYLARSASLLFNYSMNKRVVFSHNGSYAKTFFYYFLNCLVSITISYLFLNFVVVTNHLPVLPFKVASEGILFIFNYFVQSNFVFNAGCKKMSQVTSDS